MENTKPLYFLSSPCMLATLGARIKLLGWGQCIIQRFGLDLGLGILLLDGSLVVPWEVHKAHGVGVGRLAQVVVYRPSLAERALLHPADQGGPCQIGFQEEQASRRFSAVHFYDDDPPYCGLAFFYVVALG